MAGTGSSPLVLRPWPFTAYKLFNSLFTGLSVGAVFTLYGPLDPEIFSAGGIGLAIGMLLIATQYQRLLNAPWFFGISLAVEVLMLLAVTIVLIWKINAPTALMVYIGYQLMFVFGSYLVRCETLMIEDKHWLTRVDVAKQTGYLAGMALSWAIYRAMETRFGLSEKTEQVLTLHWLLLAVEVIVIVLLWLSFSRRSSQGHTAAD